MVTEQSLHNAQYRLAYFYLERLKEAGKVNWRGRESIQLWSDIIEQDWEQIRKWQSWSAVRMETQPEKARLCLAFPLSLSQRMRLYVLPSETLSWAMEAVKAASILDDREAELELLYLICLMYSNMDHIDDVERYANQLAECALIEEDTVGLSRAWGMLGRVKEFRGEYDDAEPLLLKSLHYTSAHSDNNEQLSLWQALDRIALYRGDYKQAHMYHLRILETAQAGNKAAHVGIAHLTLSGVLIYMGDYQAAAHHAEQAVVMGNRLRFTRFIPAALLGLAHAKKWLGEYESAAIAYDEVLINRHLLAPTNLANALQGRGHVEFLRGDVDSALNYLKEALDHVPPSALTYRFDISRDMAIAYTFRQEMDTALVFLKDALKTAQTLGTPRFMAMTLAVATLYYKHSGDLEQAGVLAGLLSRYTQHLQPSLFNSAIFSQIEADVGTALYQSNFRRGKSLSLDAVVTELSTQLG